MLLTRRLSLSVARLLAFVFAITSCAPLVHAETLKDRVERLTTSEGRIASGAPVASADALRKLYALRNYAPIWSDAGAAAALKEAVATSWFDGLRPEDFHASKLGPPADSPSTADSADRELLMSDALLRLLYQIYFGKVDPNGVDPNWNYDRPLIGGNPIEEIHKSLATDGVAKLIDKARLKHPFYLALKATLQAYTEYASRGGWKPIPAGAVLKPGIADPRVPAVRDRLLVTGEYGSASPAAGDIYDPPLVEAVKKFQRQHGIDDDGVLGAQTINAMNVSVDKRIDQIRVNLERGRWVLRSIADEPDLVIVNIAGFYLAVRLNGEIAWTTRVIVGQTYRKTPVFSEAMRHIVLNPDWTVPRSIAVNEILPKAKADPSYLDTQNFDLLDASGRRVAATAVNWPAMSGTSFPYRIVQRPGPTNALGLVKFIFPNKHNVYLHDTPSRGLFEKSGRTFSHGCIRVKDPLKLAEILLGNRAGWSRSQIDAAVAQGGLRQVNLTRPLPVMILYWTVDPNFDGTARFYHDVYGRDARLLAALDAPFKPAGP